jgi:hypothetical protein
VAAPTTLILRSRTLMARRIRVQRS